MKIAVNVSWMMPGQAGGMEWYVRALLDELAVLDSKNDYLLITAPMNDSTFTVLPEKWERLVYQGGETNPMAYRSTPPAHHAHTPPHLDQMLLQEGIDLLFCPLMYALPMNVDIPTVVTIPDLQHEALPELFDSFELGSRNIGFPAAAATATAILGISEHVTQEVRKAFDIEPERVVATPLGLNPDFVTTDAVLDFYRESVRAKYRLERDFLFFPGNAWPHKNHVRLIEAFEEVLVDHPDLQLVFTGSAAIESFIPARLHEQVVHLGYVSREHLIGLMAEAAALAFPSRFEGFGLPLLEAMSVETPIVCSDIPTLREVGGDVPGYFDPDDSTSIRDAIIRVVTDPNERSRQRAAMADRLKRFDYKVTAAKTLEVFEDIAAGRRRRPTPDSAPVRPLDGNRCMYDGHASWKLKSPKLESLELEAVAVAHNPDGRSYPPRRIAVAVDGVVIGEVRLEVGGSSRDIEATVPSWLPERSQHVVSLHDLSSEAAAAVSGVRIASLDVHDGLYGEVRVL